MLKIMLKNGSQPSDMSSNAMQCGRHSRSGGWQKDLCSRCSCSHWECGLNVMGSNPAMALGRRGDHQHHLVDLRGVSSHGIWASWLLQPSSPHHGEYTQLKHAGHSTRCPKHGFTSLLISLSLGTSLSRDRCLSTNYVKWGI